MILRQVIRLRALNSAAHNVSQKRNAKVFKRVYQPPRLPENATQEDINQSVFTDDFQYMKYRIVEENDVEPGLVKVLLLKSSEEYGRRGRVTSINARAARQDLLLPGLAVYASPENLEKYKDIVLPEDSVQYSSETTPKSVAELSKFVVPIVMNGEHDWTLEPWNVQMALVRQGVFVDQSCIELPEKPINGPKASLEHGEFLLKLKINDFETVNIRAVLFFQTLENAGRSVTPPGWENRFYAPIFKEQEEALKMMPRNKITSEDVANLPDASEILAKYAAWKTERDTKLFAS